MGASSVRLVYDARDYLQAVAGKPGPATVFLRTNGAGISVTLKKR